MNQANRLVVSPDALHSGGRIFNRELYNFEDLNRRIRSLWESLPEDVRIDPELAGLWTELQKHASTVVRGLENFGQELRKRSDLYEGLDLDLARAIHNLDPQLHSLINLLSGRDRARYQTLGSNSTKYQREIKLGSVSAAGGPPLSVTEVPKYEPTGYVVQPGESLRDIAASHKVGVDDLLRLNPGVYDPNAVSQGETIIVPTFTEVAAAHTSGAGSTVELLAQSNSVSCGQTSVAMAVNHLTGKHLTDVDINQKYGFGLMDALRSESAQSGYTWQDGGDLSRDHWSLIEAKVSAGDPVIVGLNGEPFSCSGRGHIVTITKVEGDQVFYNDPNGGEAKVTTKATMENCPSHPDGKFIYYPERLG